MLAAVIAHENIHEAHLLAALPFVQPDIAALFNGKFDVADAPGMTEGEAVAIMEANEAYLETWELAWRLWSARFNYLLIPDHIPGGDCEEAERAILNPVIFSFCEAAPTCSLCN